MHQLISFDLTNMFTNIPVARTVNIMTDLLHQNHTPPVVIDEFRVLITQCTSKNLCTFRGTTYVFPDGLPAGGPLSMLVAEVFVDHLETAILRSSPYSKFIHFWARYMDHILCVWTGNVHDIQPFLHELNNFDSASLLNLMVKPSTFLTSASS